MSSHHIVREKQEPALLILGLDTFTDEHLGQLLEWNPTVIVTEPVAEKLNAYGIKIDWILTDGPHHDIQSDIKLLPLNSMGLISSAFEFLIVNNYSAVNVVTDELIMEDYLPFIPQINLVVFYAGQKIYAVNSGFSKWKSAGEKVNFLSPPADVTVTGLEKTVAHQYQTTTDGIFTIRHNAPFLIIAEDI